MTTTKIALTVGVNSYPDQPLRVCVDDAKEMYAALSMQEYGFDVQRLLDKEVTRKGLRKKLDSLLRTKADHYLFYFSGHGFAADIGVYLVTVDSEPDEPGVELDYLKRLITRVAPELATVIVILDCCHSGAAVPKGTPSGIAMRSQDVVSALPALPQGRVVLAACRGDQLAYEDPMVGHSVFTAQVLSGLLGEAADTDGAVSVTGLFDYVSRAMRTSGLQLPVFRGDIAGRLVLGQGFLPRTQPQLTEERVAEIEREAVEHMEDYQARVTPALSNLSQWKAEGHKMACQMLEPILSWFDKQLQEHPQLQTTPEFMANREAAIQRLSTLCGIDAETSTILGVVSQKLGAGAFGTVWKVRRDPPLQPLAYKVYHAQELTINEKVIRFRHGYEAMKRLDHPHIVKVHRFTRCPLGFYMDLIDGPNFRNFVGTLDSPQEMLAILLRIGDTLRHAHNRRVVHRDVKPENIILSLDPATGQWSPFLTDFDLAWFPTATQITKEAMGVVHYAAPEQFANPGSASAHAPTADSYAFGQLCFFGITGSNPIPLGVADRACPAFS